MDAFRGFAAAVMSKGVLSPGWYSILTGAAMLLVVWMIIPAADTDRAVPVVAIVLGLAGFRCLSRGLRVEYQRRAPRA